MKKAALELFDNLLEGANSKEFFEDSRFATRGIGTIALIQALLAVAVNLTGLLNLLIVALFLIGLVVALDWIAFDVILRGLNSPLVDRVLQSVIFFVLSTLIHAAQPVVIHLAELLSILLPLIFSVGLVYPETLGVANNCQIYWQPLARSEPSPLNTTTIPLRGPAPESTKKYGWQVKHFARRHGAYQLFPQTQSLRVMCL